MSWETNSGKVLVEKWVVETQNTHIHFLAKKGKSPRIGFAYIPYLFRHSSRGEAYGGNVAKDKKFVIPKMTAIAGEKMFHIESLNQIQPGHFWLHPRILVWP
jgi:hypothetical protein